jgi:hypothetical protein
MEGVMVARTRIFLNPSDSKLEGKYAEGAEHVHVVCDSALMAFSVALPNAITQEGREFVIYNHPSSGAGNDITITVVYGQYINVVNTTHVLAAWDSHTFVSDLKGNWLLS